MGMPYKQLMLLRQNRKNLDRGEKGGLRPATQNPCGTPTPPGTFGNQAGFQPASLHYLKTGGTPARQPGAGRSDRLPAWGAGKGSGGQANVASPHYPTIPQFPQSPHRFPLVSRFPGNWPVYIRLQRDQLGETGNEFGNWA